MGRSGSISDSQTGTRNFISGTSNCEIRSYDYLTDCIFSRQFYPISVIDPRSIVIGEMTLEDSNEMCNPFLSSLSFDEWKRAFSSTTTTSVMVG